MEPRVFPLVTQERQQEYEQQCIRAGATDKTPMICGYYGRACYRMNDPKGACRTLCMGCALAEHCKAEEQRAPARR